MQLQYEILVLRIQLRIVASYNTKQIVLRKITNCISYRKLLIVLQKNIIVLQLHYTIQRYLFLQRTVLKAIL